MSATTPPVVPERDIPEPNRAAVARWASIVTRSLAIVAVVLVVGSVAIYLQVRAPTEALNGFLSDLQNRRDAHAWTQLCRADQREVPQATFVADWQHQRAKYGAVISKLDAFTFEPFGTVRHFHYRLQFANATVETVSYAVDVVRENGAWKVCGFFSMSRNPHGGGVLSGFQNS